jgi:adenine phosphoribosyltransferase
MCLPHTVILPQHACLTSDGWKELDQMTERERYAVEIDGVVRQLPLFEVAPGVRIAVLNILGDTEFVAVAARKLMQALDAVEFDLFATPEAKSIPLAHELSRISAKKYVVLRKSFKIYMGEAILAETVSITTGNTQTLYLDEKDRERIKGSRVVLVDDVVSTGSTLEGMRKVMDQAGARVVGEAAIFTEGRADDWQDIISLGHLPLFLDEG